MNLDDQRLARTRTPKRRPFVRSMWTAVAFALTAALLPAALSWASTGEIPISIPRVVEAITGDSSPVEPVQQTEQAPPTPSVPAADTNAEDLVAVLSDTSDVVTDAPDDHGSREQRARRSHSADDRSHRRREKSVSRADEDAADGFRHVPDPARTDESAGAVTADDAPAGAPPVASNDDKPRAEEPTPQRRPVVVPAQTARPVTVTPASTLPAPADDASNAIEPPVAPAPADDSAGTDKDPTAPTHPRRTFSLDGGESVTVVVNVPEVETPVTLWARGTASGCVPKLAVLVDGELHEMLDLAGTEWLDHAVEPVSEPGVHTVRLVAIGTDEERGCANPVEGDRIAVVEPVAGEAGTQSPESSANDATAETDPVVVDATDPATTDASAAAQDAAGATAAGDSSTAPAVDDSTTAAADDSTTAAPEDSTTAATDSTGAATAESSPEGAPSSVTPTGSAATEAGESEAPIAASLDVRREFVLYPGESVALNLDPEATGALTFWARASSADCLPNVSVSLDRRLASVVDVKGTDWTAHEVEDVRRNDALSVQLGFAGLLGDVSCADRTADTVTLVEPMSGEAGTAQPGSAAAKVQDGSATADAPTVEPGSAAADAANVDAGSATADAPSASPEPPTTDDGGVTP